jgi:hypothetical protein
MKSPLFPMRQRIEKMTIEEMYCPNGYGISVKGSPEAWQKGKKLNLCRFFPEGIRRPTLAESSYSAVYSLAKD